MTSTGPASGVRRPASGVRLTAAADTAAAAGLLERCAATYSDLGNRFGQALTLRQSAELSVVTGALDRATTQVESALALWREIRCPDWSARTLEHQGRARRPGRRARRRAPGLR